MKRKDKYEKFFVFLCIFCISNSGSSMVYYEALEAIHEVFKWNLSKFRTKTDIQNRVIGNRSYPEIADARNSGYIVLRF